MSTPSILRLSPGARARAGKITPAWQPDGFDRPAFFTLEGAYYDVHGYLIEPGVRLNRDAEAMEAEFAPSGEYGTAEGDLPIGTLIALASTMPLDDLRAAAERILGVGRVHRSRQQITYQLKTHARTSPGVDLEAFVRGDTRTSLVQVRRYIAARLGKVVTSRRQALGLLRDEGLIGPPPKRSATGAAGAPVASTADDLAEGGE